MLTSRPTFLSLVLLTSLLLCVTSPSSNIFAHSLVKPPVTSFARGQRFQPLLQKGALAEADQLYAQAQELFDKSQYDAAISSAERALVILEKAFGAKHPHVGTVLNLLALSHQAKGDYMRAEPLFQRALVIYEKAFGEKNRDVATATGNLAGLYAAKGDFTRAEPLYQRALAIFEKVLGKDDPDLAMALNSFAAFYRQKGDFTRAEPLFQRALAIFEKALGTEHYAVGMTLDNLAGMYHEKGDYARAELLFERALKIREKALGPENPDVALTLNNMAGLYKTKGDSVRAEALYRRALAVWEKALGPEHYALAMPLDGLASIYAYRGDNERAEPLFRRALAISEKVYGSEHYLVAVKLNNLAHIYESKGDYRRAEELKLRALVIFEKVFGAEHYAVATTLNGLATLYINKGDYERAEPFLYRSIAIKEKSLGPEHPLLATELNNLAFLYDSRGDYAHAEPLYRRALMILEKTAGENHPDVGTVLSGLATLYEATGDTAQALRLQTRAGEIREHHLALILTTGSENQKRLYLDTRDGDVNVNISLHLRSAPTSEEAARLALTTILRLKGRVLDAMTDQVTSLRRRLDTQDRALLDQLAAARTQLAALVLKGPGETDPAQYRAEVARLEGEGERLEAQVSARSAEFRALAQPVTLERVQRAIPEEGALVEIASYTPFNAKAKTPGERFGEERYVAYVLRRGGAPAFADLGEAAPINRRIRELRAALGDRHSTDVKQAARALDELVMRPVRPLLGGSYTVLISPDGALNLIPFGALVNERGRYLVEDYTFDYLTSGRDLPRLEERAPSRQPPIIIANPLFDLAVTAADPPAPVARDIGERRSAELSQISWPQLAGTAGEAAGIKRFLPNALVLTEAQATEAAVKRVSGPLLLHVATHGFFLPDQPRQEAARTRGLGLSDEPRPVRGENSLLRSGLVFAGVNKRQSGSGEDGVLTALEAAGLDLWGTKLVVLSACQTGEGDVSNGEGVYGLRRALVLAGAESELMSLWLVDDAATRDLMVEYYQRLQAGEGRITALRQVQLKMLRGDEQRLGARRRELQAEPGGGPRASARSHPYFWASFIPIGDWRPLVETGRSLAETPLDKTPPSPAGMSQPAVRKREVTPRPTTSVPPANKPKSQSVAEMMTAGKTKYHAGDFAGAASLFERALALDPSNADARVGLGNTYIQQTPPAYDRAIAEYRKALSINPRHEMAWQQLAAVALHKKSLLMARDAIEHLAKINPSNLELNRLRVALVALER